MKKTPKRWTRKMLRACAAPVRCAETVPAPSIHCTLPPGIPRAKKMTLVLPMPSSDARDRVTGRLGRKCCQSQLCHVLPEGSVTSRRRFEIENLFCGFDKTCKSSREHSLRRRLLHWFCDRHLRSLFDLRTDSIVELVSKRFLFATYIEGVAFYSRNTEQALTSLVPDARVVKPSCRETRELRGPITVCSGSRSFHRRYNMQQVLERPQTGTFRLLYGAGQCYDLPGEKLAGVGGPSREALVQIAREHIRDPELIRTLQDDKLVIQVHTSDPGPDDAREKPSIRRRISLSFRRSSIKRTCR